MICSAQYLMLLMRANPLRGQVGVETFLGPVKWHRAVRRVPFAAHGTALGGVWEHSAVNFSYRTASPPPPSAVNLNHKTD
jgi:hypothetical protein